MEETRNSILRGSDCRGPTSFPLVPSLGASKNNDIYSRDNGATCKVRKRVEVPRVKGGQRFIVRAQTRIPGIGTKVRGAGNHTTHK
jgi:hypothetical protein